VHELSPDLLLLVKTQQARIGLKIEMPLNRPCSYGRGLCCVAAGKTIQTDKFGIGLSYVQIDKKIKARLIRTRLD